MTQIKNFIDVGDPDAPIGSAAWCKAVHVHLCAMKRQTDKEIRRLKYDLLEFREKQRWQQLADDRGRPFRSWEDYVQYPEPNGLGLAVESAKAVMEALNDKVLLGTVLGKHGRPKKGEEKGSNRTLNRGTTRAYILARLDRDGHTDLAARVRAGKISAKAAAEEAGIRKPPPTSIEIILKHLSKLTRLQLRQVIARGQELLGEEPKRKRAA